MIDKPESTVTHYLVYPSRNGQIERGGLPRVVKADSPEHATQSYYGHAIVVPCHVFPDRGEDPSVKPPGYWAGRCCEPLEAEPLPERFHRCFLALGHEGPHAYEDEPRHRGEDR